MIGLVRELTRASLFAAAWKLVIAFSCLSRMKFSSVKALTIRMPCAVSCQRLHHLHRALELARHDLAHANADLAHAEHRERHEHEREDTTAADLATP